MSSHIVDWRLTSALLYSHSTTSITDLCIDNLQFPRWIRSLILCWSNKRHEWGTEQHLHNPSSSLVICSLAVHLRFIAPGSLLLEWTLPKGSQFRIVYPFLWPTAIHEKSWLKLQHYPLAFQQREEVPVWHGLSWRTRRSGCRLIGRDIVISRLNSKRSAEDGREGEDGCYGDNL